MRGLAQLALIAALGATLIGHAAQAETISVRGDVWCPYNCEPGSDKPGYMIEIAKTVFGKTGIEVDYQVLNWARTLDKVRAGELTAAVGAAKTDAPDFVYPETPLGKSSNVFAARADDTFVYKDIGSLDGKSLGVINGYTYTGAIDDYLTKNKADAKKIQSASGDDALATNLNKLVAKRLDLVVEDSNVLSHQIAVQKLGDKVRIVDTTLPVAEVYIAFSPKNPKSAEYAAKLAAGIAEMRASGQLATILAKYGVKDFQ